MPGTKVGVGKAEECRVRVDHGRLLEVYIGDESDGAAVHKEDDEDDGRLIVSLRAPENRGCREEEEGEGSTAEGENDSEEAGNSALGDADIGVSDALSTGGSPGVLGTGLALESVGEGASCLGASPSLIPRRLLVLDPSSFFPACSRAYCLLARLWVHMFQFGSATHGRELGPAIGCSSCDLDIFVSRRLLHEFVRYAES